MKKYNFQNWLNQKESDDPEVILARKLEYLRLYLSNAMRLRTRAGLTQAQLAQKLGVQQAAVSKLESALKEHELESVFKYLHKLGADFLVALKHGEELYQVGDKESGVLLDLPLEVQDLASAVEMSQREYIQAAVRHFSQQVVSVKASLATFLESDDQCLSRYSRDWDGDRFEKSPLRWKNAGAFPKKMGSYLLA